MIGQQAAGPLPVLRRLRVADRPERPRAGGPRVDGRGPLERGIARQIWVAEATVEKHVHSILGKLDLPDSTDDHQRVLAVLAYLSSAGT